MEKNSIELVKVILGLRKEYLRNGERLKKLSELVKVDSNKFSDYYFYLLKTNNEIKVLLNLFYKKITFRDRLKYRGEKGILKRDIVGSNGSYHFTYNSGVDIINPEEFSHVIEELKHDPYLNTSFDSVSRFGDKNSIFRICFDGVSYDEVNNDDPRGLRYYGSHDIIHIVYYEPLYDLLKSKYALDLLNVKIDKDNIPNSKLNIIENSGVLDKKILIDDDIKFTHTQDRRAILDLEPKEEEKTITLIKK